ncbi:hypothetical protein JX265_001637 [Neoarthrinium moseri]|uniref:Uncharacterized protein n=1 Tax=Neoarthrinium moseri TaxID=1658444 RepID=A0A9P9WVY4_9PEZI|nr:hypothetical protein JX265_001637 [Neoarthrinium moseri]
MHTKLEKHYEHVAAHFESGGSKPDWMHSNVIYGLLHQPAVLDAWRELITRKQSKFNGHQPMFSWNLDNTGRQQGYVENESQGQLQDFLEFFDGSSEQAQRIAQCAWGHCHVVLKPKSTEEAVPARGQSNPPSQDQCSLSRQVTITSQSRGLRRVASTSLMPVSRQPTRRVASTDFREHMQGMQYTSPVEQGNPYQQSFMAPPQSIPSQHHQISPQQLQVEPMQMNPRPLSLDKELPPAPLVPSPMDSTPMDVDYNMFGGDTNEQLLKPEMQVQDWQSFSSAQSFSDTQSFSSALMEEQAMVAQAHNMAAQSQGFSMSWEDLNHYGAQHHRGNM